MTEDARRIPPSLLCSSRATSKNGPEIIKEERLEQKTWLEWGSPVVKTHVDHKFAGLLD